MNKCDLCTFFILSVGTFNTLLFNKLVSSTLHYTLLFYTIYTKKQTRRNQGTFKSALFIHEVANILPRLLSDFLNLLLSISIVPAIKTATSVLQLLGISTLGSFLSYIGRRALLQRGFSCIFESCLVSNLDSRGFYGL